MKNIKRSLKLDKKNASVVIIGIIYDRFGTLMARVVTTLLVTFGLLLVGLAKSINSLLFPGIVLWFSGSFSMSLTNVQLAQLFPKAEVFVMTWSYAISLLSGSTFRLWKVSFLLNVNL